MTATTEPVLTNGYRLHHEADAIVSALVADMLSRNPALARFAHRLHADAGIRLVDVTDYIAVPAPMASRHGLRDALVGAGFTRDARPGADECYAHRTGIFPDILVTESDRELGLFVESVDDFLAANGVSAAVSGPVGDRFRRAEIERVGDATFSVVERHGYTGFVPPEESAARRDLAARWQQVLHARERNFDGEARGFVFTEELLRAAVTELGDGWACDLFLRAERTYWESRNQTGRLQKARQDALGIGWANDDHHTYDASREWFRPTIAILELLGFTCRERFYAGAGAGWGSQILEHPILGTVIFADLDLAPEELEVDFAHSDLGALPTLRRAGLWCALHGESVLEAGINHLECMFDQVALRAQLADRGVRMMEPFSNFPHLYQELSHGEWWPVREERIARLESAGLITAQAAQAFRSEGAIGSHLENLERNFGFKGFNQPGIDQVLSIIDPRRQMAGSR